MAEKPKRYSTMDRRYDDIQFEPGRVPITDPDAPHEFTTHELASWMVYDWSPRLDAAMRSMVSDVFDLADRVHYLAITIICVFILIVGAVGVTLAVMLT